MKKKLNSKKSLYAYTWSSHCINYISLLISDFSYGVYVTYVRYFMQTHLKNFTDFTSLKLHTFILNTSLDEKQLYIYFISLRHAFWPWVLSWDSAWCTWCGSEHSPPRTPARWPCCHAALASTCALREGRGSWSPYGIGGRDKLCGEGGRWNALHPCCCWDSRIPLGGGDGGFDLCKHQAWKSVFLPGALSHFLQLH